MRAVELMLVLIVRHSVSLRVTSRPYGRRLVVAMSERRSNVDRLNDLFYESGTGPMICEETGSIRNLPLWRVQWNALPGTREVYNVHVPHYTNMFEGLVRHNRPWYFGHSYLPGGSTNLRNAAYALEEGTRASLTGTLMEVVDATRLRDGRLCVLAQGVGRFRVTDVTRETPHFEVDASLVLDDEELEDHGDAAARRACEWRPIEYPTRDIVRLAAGTLRVPELALVADGPPPASMVGDPNVASLETECWVALVRCGHLLLQCLKKHGAAAADAALVLPEAILKLQPPNVADKILVGADCLGDTRPPCPLPPQRRAMRFSFVAVAAVASGLLDQTNAHFAALNQVSVDLTDRAGARQALLDATSTAKRLALVLRLLDSHAAKLTAFLLL